MNTWITIEKAASILNVPTIYVYGLINRGELNTVDGCLLASEVIAYSLVQDAICIECVYLPGDTV